MECHQNANSAGCNCTYVPCPRKGQCCECIKFHLQSRELPACCFPSKAESTFDRSFEHFSRLVSSGEV